MSELILLSLASAFTPTLVAATTLMMLLPQPKKLMLGYLAGAAMTSLTIGLVIVFTLERSSAVSTTEQSVSPGLTIAVGAAALVAALVLRARQNGRAPERSSAVGEPERVEPKWRRSLSTGSMRTTFAVGAVLTLPGAAYLAGLRQIDRLNYSTFGTVISVIAFNVVMLASLEIPLLCFTIAPDWTVASIHRLKNWISPRRHELVIRGLSIVGAVLVLKGVIELIA